MVPNALTLDNLPPELLERLAARAKQNGRSLNDEVLATLQTSFGAEADAAILLAEADRFVENLSFWTTPAEIAQYRNAGRR